MSPEKEITTYLFQNYPKLDFILYFLVVMGQSKMPITKEKN
jgi:hypothetical protein